MGSRGPWPLPNFQNIWSFCALRGGIPKKVPLPDQNHKFWLPSLWPGHATDEDAEPLLPCALSRCWFNVPPVNNFLLFSVFLHMELDVFGDLRQAVRGFGHHPSQGAEGVGVFQER